ncbi:MAG TPA: glycosyltransferase family 1 protein [Patescibacteria group bacterium]|nr:glycosyltransferase family 1 protein [Patescibacteria group bacterium]
MKIGIDCRLWNETGVGRYIRNLIAELSEIDTVNDYMLFLRKNEYETVPMPRKNFQKKLADVQWHTLAEQSILKKIIEEEKLDVMHFPYFSYPVGYKGKFIITIHDLIIDHFSTGKASTLFAPFYFLKRLGYKFVLKSAIKHAQKIIAVSGATKQEIIDHYNPNPDRVVVTYEGIEKTLAKENEEKIDVKKPFFFSVGNAYPHKNLERLLDAFSEFYKKNSNSYYIFVGKQDYFSKELEKLVKEKKLSNNVFFYREVSDGQLSYLYHHALGLVVPSLMEGFGLPALEAMSNGCLVLASEIPAFLEVCGDIPIYFDPYNVEDIAEKLESVYKGNVSHIAEKKKEGIARSKRYSWKKMAQKTLEIYQSIS